MLPLTLFPSFYVEVCCADILKTRQLPAVDTYNYYYIFQGRQSKISISRTSSILLTLYGFLGKHFLRGLCNVYASCVPNHAFIWPDVFCFSFVRLLGAWLRATFRSVCGPDKAAAAGVFICLLVAATACCSVRKLENADVAEGSV